MKQLQSMVMVCCAAATMCFAAVPLLAQNTSRSNSEPKPLQSPDIDVTRAKAEFISSPNRPHFAVVGIVVKGDVDTLSVIVHPSAIQSIDGKYRYKPRVVSTRRIDSLFEIVLELSGKGIPLPDDSVRGSARLSVRGAGNFRGSRVRFESRRFDVFVANVPLPTIMIYTNDMKVDPIFDNTTGLFKVKGIMVRVSKKGIDSMEDIREMTIDSVFGAVNSAEVSDVRGKDHYNVAVVGGGKLVSGSPSNGTYEFTFRLTSGKFPLSREQVRGSASIAFTVHANHRGTKRMRIKMQTVPIRN